MANTNENETTSGVTQSSAEELHQRLTDWNRHRLAPSFDATDWENQLKHELALRVLEGRFVEEERRLVHHDALSAPTDPDGFIHWFEALKERGPGQNDPLFDWLADEATLAEMRWFLGQEVAGEAGFDDLVALTQVKLPARAKLELARNYWDEMGQGNEGGMHGPMLEHLARQLKLGEEAVVWESLALGNLMAALGTNRHYTYQSIGALGAIELTAPTRAVKVNAGLKRLGVGGDVRRYFALHATLDVRHSEAWDREVIRPLVTGRPELARPIAEGALMRLNAGLRCFERYRRELGLTVRVRRQRAPGKAA